MTSPLAAVCCVAAGVAGLLAGCTPPSPERPAPGVQRAELGCKSEAEQLLQPVLVFGEPAAEAALLGELEAGRFVYRCDRRGAWTAIMYPAPGEAVDCASRPAGRRCQVGWVHGDVPTAIFG
ncbi:MAG TPA: hypothetical protein VLE23_00645 [Geminicoccaceae bacterium]|nr:hypothetical protein [Geminicoccaceae bacterium]